ncbi:MAG: hypothetical protein M3270_11755 [Thermoproteota archaeon]|nr:hypothetical protein [Thermoproteota archaeon]
MVDYGVVATFGIRWGFDYSTKSKKIKHHITFYYWGGSITGNIIYRLASSPCSYSKNIQVAYRLDND